MISFDLIHITATPANLQWT